MLAARALAACLLIAAVAPARGGELPLPGRTLSITARVPPRTTFRFRSAVTAQIDAPVPDPRGGASLVVFASNAAGQCRAEIALDPGGWTPIGRDGPRRGWRFRDPQGAAQGVRSITIATNRRGGGRITAEARGAAFPCTLATPQTLPVIVTLRLPGTRYCAAFDASSVRANLPGRLRAAGAPPPPTCPDDDVTVADLNVLHGLFCPAGSGNCRLADRIALLGQWVHARGCPDVVTLQEVADVVPGMPALLETVLGAACPVPYHAVFVRTVGVDDQMILSRHRVLSREVLDLYGPLRNVLHAGIDHPIGVIDVYSTHLASGSDGATNPCGSFGPCPAECTAAGAATVRECQAVQTAKLVEDTHTSDAPAFLTGDLNAPAGSFVHGQLTARGWVDTFLAAGNPECVAATGAGCTSARIDDALTHLEDPATNQSERIDFIFLVPPGPTSSCTAAIDSPADADGDGIATRLFADEPNPFAPSCGPAPAPPCWPSDHTGVQADVSCRG